MAKRQEYAGATAPATIEEALIAIATLEETIATHEGTISELSNEIAVLEAANDKAAEKLASGDKTVEVTVEGETYVVNHGARIGQVNYTAKQLADNKNLLAEIMEIEGQQVVTLKLEDK